jgi:hypothetical protein
MNSIIQECRQKAKEWELQRRTFQKQIEMSDSQMMALTETWSLIKVIASTLYIYLLSFILHIHCKCGGTF